MAILRQLRASIGRLETGALEKELLAACGRPAVVPRHTDALEAAEGLLPAAILSTVLWSLILFVLSRLR